MDKIIISNKTDEELIGLSSNMLLSLSLDEMKTIKDYFAALDREPSLMELEVIAQTWSEHCIHKTMTGLIEYEEHDCDGNPVKKETIDNLLKETVFRGTKELDKDYCLSVFKDNAGVIEFNDEYGIAMKVETHNHPSALEPYGGSATGIGGVIRDILGVGQGAKPVMNIDVFCFGPLDIRMEEIPQGVLHPRRIFRGVVRGVRDYGNRMGIPTSSGAILFDENYIYNPLVYCGTVGVMPKKYIDKEVKSGDLIVAIGGRTGRDGIHGATFSSIALDEDTDIACVQIGDAITEKKFTDVLLKIRDMELYNAVTDCGAGGFSSAVGEMGEHTGARVYLENAPLKYEGLLPWEIFVSESQERMVLSVPPENYDKIKEILNQEDVETAILGEFTDTGRLELFYKDEKQAELEMSFLHDGVPNITKKAVWKEKKNQPVKFSGNLTIKELFSKIISHPNVASKEVVIRQYDHEVQGGSVSKPLAGADQDAPQDGCVTRPLLDEDRGISVGLGINPLYGYVDPYRMALSCCEEAARNIVASGGHIDKAAFMDNFCWGDTGEEEILGDLVRASKGCYDASKMLSVPFTSGKDSLNNCYYVNTKNGRKKINIPGTLLITCVAPVHDLDKVAGSEFKKAGHTIYLIGDTYPETGGSILANVLEIQGGVVPDVRNEISLKTLMKVQEVIGEGLIKSIHDLSDGGLAVALAEMTFGGIGAEADISKINLNEDCDFSHIEDYNNADTVSILKLFSESNSRFLVEIEEENIESFEAAMKDMPVYKIGKTTQEEAVYIKAGSENIIYNEEISTI